MQERSAASKFGSASEGARPLETGPSEPVGAPDSHAARLYDVADMTGERPLINGRPLPEGVTMQDWMRLTQASGFYGWKNAVRGCVTGRYWRLTEKVGWCGV